MVFSAASGQNPMRKPTLCNGLLCLVSDLFIYTIFKKLHKVSEFWSVPSSSEIVSSHLQIALTVEPNSVVVSLPFYVMMGTDPPPTNVFFQHKTTNKVQTLEHSRVTHYYQKALELVQYFSNLIAPSDTDELPGE